MEEGLTCLHALTFGDVDLGDEARYLGADLGIVLASDDGGVTVVGGEVACGEGAYGGVPEGLELVPAEPTDWSRRAGA